jgi:hypothetical protein
MINQQMVPQADRRNLATYETIFEMAREDNVVEVLAAQCDVQ